MRVTKIMTKTKGKLYIGTSGWVYAHWRKVFYPEDLLVKDKLKYFSKYFKTVEVNYSFYHLPSPSSYENWYKQVSKNFLFAVKASRFITHIKRLKNIKQSWKIFINNALHLKEKLGPILFQFSPNFIATEENIKRLQVFLKYITSFKPQVSIFRPKFALEFRHFSWFVPKIYKLLKKYDIGLVIADSPNYPKTEEITADFVYLRMHGSKTMFSSKYTDKELKELAQKIKKWLEQKLNVYCYFNNDAAGYAVENAKTLKIFLNNL